MQYADALPALITDNIGNAPLTVCLQLVPLFLTWDCTPLSDLCTGVDVYAEAHNPNREQPPISEADVEIPRRA